MRSHVVSGLLVMGLLSTGSVARAQDPAAPPAAVDPMAPAPVAPVATAGAPELESVTLAPGRILIVAPLAINLSKELAFKPVSIPLDVYYGVNEALTVGLTHSGGVNQVSDFYDAGSGVCLTGKDNGCAKFYNNVGLDVLYKFLPGTVQLAGHGGIDLWSIDPMFAALRLGVLLKAPLASNLALYADPRIWIGLNKRDAGNFKQLLRLPVGVQYHINQQVRAGARIAIGGPTDHFGDLYQGSFGLFGGFALNEMVDLFAALDFPNLWGKGSSADARQLVIGANIGL